MLAIEDGYTSCRHFESSKGSAEVLEAGRPELPFVVYVE
jgi:hypothetical protein